MDPAALSALARHSEAVATARAFAEAAGALRVVLVLDDPEGAVLAAHAHDTEIREGDPVATIPAGTAVPAPAKPLPEVRRAPASAISLDLEAGEIAAPIGVIEHLAEAVEALARA